MTAQVDYVLDGFIAVAYFVVVGAAFMFLVRNLKDSVVPDAFRTWNDNVASIARGLFFAVPAALAWFILSPVTESWRARAQDQYANVLIRGLNDTLTPSLFVSLHATEALRAFCLLLAFPFAFAIVIAGFDAVRQRAA